MVYPSKAKAQKRTFSLHLKRGKQLRLSRHLLLDISKGIGLKYRHITHTGRTAPQDRMVHPRHPNVYYEAERAGSYFTFALPINIKFSYRF